MIQISLIRMEWVNQHCSDGTIRGFGRRLDAFFLPETLVPQDMLTLLATLDRLDVEREKPATR